MPDFKNSSYRSSKWIEKHMSNKIKNYFDKFYTEYSIVNNNILAFSFWLSSLFIAHYINEQLDDIILNYNENIIYKLILPFIFALVTFILIKYLKRNTHNNKNTESNKKYQKKDYCKYAINYNIYNRLQLTLALKHKFDISNSPDENIEQISCYYEVLDNTYLCINTFYEIITNNKDKNLKGILERIPKYILKISLVNINENIKWLYINKNKLDKKFTPIAPTTETSLRHVQDQYHILINRLIETDFETIISNSHSTY